MKKFGLKLREDISQRDIILFIALILFLIFWTWFSLEVLLAT